MASETGNVKKRKLQMKGKCKGTIAKENCTKKKIYAKLSRKKYYKENQKCERKIKAKPKENPLKRQGNKGRNLKKNKLIRQKLP